MRVKTSSLPVLTSLDLTAIIVVSQGGDTYQYPVSSLLSQLADNSVSSTKLADNSVTESKIADDSIVTTKIADNAVIAGKIAEGAVTLSKIADLNVSTAKLANNAVTAQKLDVSVLNGVFHYGTGAGSANAYTVTNAIPRTTLVEGLVQVFKVIATNTSASTLNVDGTGVKSIKKNGSTSLSAGDLNSGQIVTVRYDGSNWQLQ